MGEWPVCWSSLEFSKEGRKEEKKGKADTKVSADKETSNCM